MNNILVVDDQAEIRRMLFVVLGRAFQVLEADHGVAALEAVKRYRPQMVLLDIMMPGEMDGLQVLDAIKADPQTRNILVAMMSARGQPDDAEEARQRGADTYFIKPFSPTEVVAWVRNSLK